MDDDGDDVNDDDAVDDNNDNAVDNNDNAMDNSDNDDNGVHGDASSSSTTLDRKTMYRKGMEFVASYKKARTDKGKKRMDWQGCLAAGRKKGLLLKYKNANTLKNQFAKYEKNIDGE